MNPEAANGPVAAVALGRQLVVGGGGVVGAGVGVVWTGNVVVVTAGATTFEVLPQAVANRVVAPTSTVVRPPKSPAPRDPMPR